MKTDKARTFQIEEHAHGSRSQPDRGRHDVWQAFRSAQRLPTV